jgi:hypothetical protein
MDEHLGYQKHETQKKQTSNSRNGKSKKNIISEYGEQEIAVPRDRAIIEQECYRRHEFESYPHAYKVVSQFIQDYNQIRLHGSLYDFSPYEYMKAVKDGTVKPKQIKV